MNILWSQITLRLQNIFIHFKIHHLKENDKNWIQIPQIPNNFKYDTESETIQQLIYNISHKYPTRKSLGSRSYTCQKQGQPWKRGGYLFYSYADLAILASDLSNAFINVLKLKQGDKVGVLSKNKPEWNILELACASCGIILVGLYETQSKEDLQHVIKLTEISYCFTEIEIIGKYFDVFHSNSVKLVIFDDDFLTRLILIKNKEKLKFQVPIYTRTSLKPQIWYQNVNQIYIQEKNKQDFNYLKVKLNLQNQFYFYKPQTDGNEDLILKSFDNEKIQMGIQLISEFQTSFCKLLESQLQNYQQNEKQRLILGHISPYQFLNNKFLYNPNLIDKDQICTYVMTSGTSGLPKAVCLTYSNLMSTAATMKPMCLALGEERQQDYVVSFLPLSHVYQRIISLVLYIQVAAQCFISGSIKNLTEDFQYAGPTALACVPKVIQKIYSGILNQLQSKSKIQCFIFKSCYKQRLKIYKEQGIYNKFRTGQREIKQEDLEKLFYDINKEQFDIFKAVKQYPQERQKELLRLWQNRPIIQPRYENIFLLRKANVEVPKLTNIVFNIFEQHIGGRLRGAVSGSACINQNEADFFRMCFHSALFQGYGSTETSAAGTVQNFASADSSGVGIPLTKYCQLFLIDSDSYKVTDKPFPRGEIIIYGDSVFNQYLNEKQESIDERKNLMKALNLPDTFEGRKMNIFSTDDIGQFNIITGELEIIDRQSCNVKLSQGEYIQLTKIEDILNRHELVENSYVYAKSNEDFSIAVIEIKNGQKLTRQQRLELQNKIQNLKDHCIKYGLFGFQIPKYFICSFFQWDIYNNKLITPSLKVKRCTCLKLYGDLCESVYNQLKYQNFIKGETITQIIDLTDH